MKALHIFKPGKHTTVNGKVIEFTESMVAAIASCYDPAKHEAPIVVGHPKMDDPAYGWTKALSFADGALIAEPDQVEPQFAEMVNAGRFKKISVRLYPPESPHNPVPGGWYLQHIGFLGAQPPAVKGLKSASFAEGQDDAVEFADVDFADVAPWRMRSLGSVLRNIRDLFISKFSLEEADRALPSYLIEDIESVPEAHAPVAAFTESAQENPMFTKEQEAAAAKLKADQEALERQQTEFAEREAALKAAEKASRLKSIQEFVAGLVAAGQLLPRDQAGMVAYMEGPNDAGVIEFGEGDDKKSAQPNEWLRMFLRGLPKQVDFAERSGGQADDKSVSFAAPPGYTVDVERLELHNKALAYQAKHKTTYEAALVAVQ